MTATSTPARPASTTVRSSRSSLRRAATTHPLPAGTCVVDLWSVDESWQDHLEAAADAAVPVVLSTVGVDSPTTPYLQALAGREAVARRTLDRPAVLRLGPVVTDLAAWAGPLAADETVFHAYAEEAAGWLAAGDVLRVAAQVADLPAARGATVDLLGPEPTTAPALLTEWARRTGSGSTLAAVPPEVLLAQLAPVLGAATAAAVVGHQQWAGSAAVATGSASALARALPDPTPWHHALDDLTTASEETPR